MNWPAAPAKSAPAEEVLRKMVVPQSDRAGNNEPPPTGSKFGDIVAPVQASREGEKNESSFSREHFSRLSQSGFRQQLIPVAPPGVQLRTKDGPQTSGGKTPATLDPGSDQWGALPRWRNIEASPADIAAWDRSGANVGLRTGRAVALDFDIKVDSTDTSPEADRCRQLVEGMIDAVARALNVGRTKLAWRRRPDSTSCALFFRWTGCSRRKTTWTVASMTDDQKHRIELLAEGQQIVVAGVHASGAPLQSNLAEVGYAGLPELDECRLTQLVEALSQTANEVGFDWQSEVRTKVNRGGSAPAVPRPEDAVFGGLWKRRLKWVPSILPPDAATPERGEWSISSEQLARELEERLVIYDGGSGAYDFGSERKHTPVSLICEFGAVEDDGDVVFGGSPNYTVDGSHGYVVSGEPDSSIRRPTEDEALSWLGRQLAGDEFQPFPPGTVWHDALPRLAAAVGIDWSALQSVDVWRWCEPYSWPGLLAKVGFKAEETRFPAICVWSKERVLASIDLLSALHWLDHAEADKIERALSLLDKLPAGYDALIDDARRRAVQSSLPTALGNETNTGAQVSPAHTTAVATWPDPVDIFGDGDPTALAELPVDSMPGALERYARDVADRMGVSAAFTAAAALATASAAVGGQIRLQPKERDSGWTVPAFLWTVIVEDPGGKKSPVIAEMATPLTDLDAEWARDDLPKRQRWEFEAKKRGAKIAPMGPRPVMRRKLVDSFTTEALRDVLADNPRGVLVSADEITGLIGGLDQYKPTGGSDRADLLKLMDGGSRVFDRVSRSVRVDCWGASVVAGVQPKKLAKMAKDLDPDGLLQRFIPIVGDGIRRADIDRAPDEAAKAAYWYTLHGLASAPDMFDRPVVSLSPEAQQVRSRVEAQIRTLSDMPTNSDAWRGHLSKWSGFFPRILLVFHLVDVWSQLGRVDLESPVSEDTALRAERLTGFLLGHAIRFYETVIGADTAGRAAEVAAGIVLVRAAGGSDNVSRRDLYEAHRGWRPQEPKAGELYVAMQRLERYGWCLASTGASGSEIWEINPKIRERFSSRAEAEARRRREEYRLVQEAVAERRKILGKSPDA